MIASLSGVVSHIGKEGIIVEVGGVGLKVFVPAPFKDRVKAGDTVYLHTHLVVRQDALILYGFETSEGREYFELLLSVDGIGPKSALSILSVMNPDSIRRAVFQEQADVFSRAPGIGKKTAQKILLYLQDKIKSEGILEGISTVTEVDSEVLAALTSLGYSVVEAQASLQSIPRDTPQDVETRLRLALQYFTTP